MGPENHHLPVVGVGWFSYILQCSNKAYYDDNPIANFSSIRIGVVVNEKFSIP